MKIKKYVLLILSLLFINFLNLNAATTKGNIRKLNSQKAIVEMNLTYKYIENGKYTELVIPHEKYLNWLSDDNTVKYL